MPKIRIERHPVQVFNLGALGFDHLQLVYQHDDTGLGEVQDHWFTIEGLREWTGSGVRLSVEGWEGLTTLSAANGGLVGEELAAKIKTPVQRGSRVVPVGGDEAKTWTTVASFAGDIEAQGFPYIAFALPASPIPVINSSSLIGSLLYYVGIDVASVLPFGTRLSPGTTTLLGSSGDDELAIAKGLTTIVAGEGKDTLRGANGAGQIDKLYGGKDDDRFAWSTGLNVIHGGQPELAYETDGIDTIDYSGVGAVRIDAGPNPVSHYQPDFIATFEGGTDHLYSIERIAWDAGSDRIVLGRGVRLVERPVTPKTGLEDRDGTEPADADRELAMTRAIGDLMFVPDEADSETTYFAGTGLSPYGYWPGDDLDDGWPGLDHNAAHDLNAALAAGDIAQ